MTELKGDAASGELSEQASGDAQADISQPHFVRTMMSMILIVTSTMKMMMKQPHLSTLVHVGRHSSSRVPI